MLYRMKEICSKEYENFFALKNVNGIAIGNKIINNIDTNILCLKVLVEKKEDESTLSDKDKIPKYYDGILTDVEEMGKVEAYANTNKIRPAVGGYSIGLPGVRSVGTLGCLIATGTGSSEQTCILSNNHVIASANNASIGTPIIQPGDGGISPRDIIAYLSDFKPIDFTGNPNVIDCAIGVVYDKSLVSSSIAQIGNVTGIASAVIGGFVQKSGRTTGYTTGTIKAIGASINISYGARRALFTNQIIATTMSSPGDSGSIVLDRNNRIIGLLFAGSKSGTVMNDIRSVLKYFRARLL